ncbi:MAG: DNA/RNA nuclease SfsA [FCB group bacterium]|nr:DNA/RNA nuclease SfsA [FCB group bacterium]MBL7029174.1 DNA/RNA nuclease SfsA [Candidatus Neomarinimicrobiota bacterium]MBL7122989.1 DNA/RNA nuclease SfsA [Candidatus Neomarinimicrobiota bacterium]
MKMSLATGLIEAEFVDRPNRFLSKVRIDGKVHDSHVPDPGRLKELLFPGARVLVEPKSGENRRTKFATVMVYSGDELISINSQLPNRFVRHCLDNSLIPEFKGWTVKKQEYIFGKSRFDFLLERDGQEKLLEVKSATLVEDGIARFPDAVTSRGRRHVLHLAESIAPERSAAVLFIVQRSDALSFEPHWGRDPEFAQALQDSVRDGVELVVYTTKLKPDSITLKSSIPYILENMHA